MMLDATAGNRFMWKNKSPPNIIFMDKEVELARPPHIFAVWEHTPFRDNVFETVFFDPPHQWNKTKYTGIWCTPSIERNKWEKGKIPRYYGFDIRHHKLISGIIRGTKEFYRISKRLCLKWNDYHKPLWNVLPLIYKGWIEINRKSFTSKGGGKALTYWLTFINSSEMGVKK